MYNRFKGEVGSGQRHLQMTQGERVQTREKVQAMLRGSGRFITFCNPLDRIKINLSYSFGDQLKEVLGDELDTGDKVRTRWKRPLNCNEISDECTDLRCSLLLTTSWRPSKITSCNSLGRDSNKASSSRAPSDRDSAIIKLYKRYN